MSIKQSIFNHIKNIPGWRTKRKLVVISVDDYGNVRLDSKKARENMDKAGLKIHSRFDAFDTLETREDLEALFEVWTSVKDKNGNHAVFTTFAMPCNINFEKMREEGNSEYIYELLPETYKKLSQLYPKDYQGTWSLWKEGISARVLAPQFHGREHLNLKLLKSNLRNKENSTLISLANRSYTSINNSSHPNLSFTTAFDFENQLDIEGFSSIISDGVLQFNEVFGYQPKYFNPPGGRENNIIHSYLNHSGILFMDSPLIKVQKEVNGEFSRKLFYLGKQNKFGQTFLIRNVVFEPGVFKGDSSVSLALSQIKAAFKLNKPAIISSHRVNFSGLIDQNSRRQNLIALSKLLMKIKELYPDVEFVSALELGEIITGYERK